MGAAPQQILPEQTTVCPCCGQGVIVNRPLINLDLNVISFNGRIAVLTGREAEIVFVLAREMPHSVSHAKLEDAVWGPHRGLMARNLVSVMMTHVRPKLVPLNLRIVTIHGRGYRLVSGYD